MSKSLSITERIKQRQQEAIANLKAQTKKVSKSTFSKESDVFDPIEEVSPEDEQSPKKVLLSPTERKPKTPPNEPSEKESDASPEEKEPQAPPSESEESSESSSSDVSTPLTAGREMLDPKERRKVLRLYVDAECDSGSASEDEDGNRIKKKRKGGRRKNEEEESEDEENSEDRKMIDNKEYDHSREPSPYLAFQEADALQDELVLRKASLIVSGAENEALHKKALLMGREKPKNKRFASKVGTAKSLGALLSSEEIDSNENSGSSSSEDTAEKMEREEEERKVMGDESSSSSSSSEEEEEEEEKDRKKDETKKTTRRHQQSSAIAGLSQATTINRREVIEEAAAAIEVGLSQKPLVTSDPTRRDISRFLSALYTVATGSLPESGKNKGTRETIVSVDNAMPFNTRTERVRRQSVEAIRNTEKPGYMDHALFRRLLGSHVVALFPMSLLRNIVARQNCVCALTGAPITEGNPIELLLVHLTAKKKTVAFPIAAHALVGPFGKVVDASVSANPKLADDVVSQEEINDAMDIDSDGSGISDDEDDEEAAERAEERIPETTKPPSVPRLVVKAPDLLVWYIRELEGDRKKTYSNLPNVPKARKGKPPVYFGKNGLPNCEAYDWARIAEYYLVRAFFTTVQSDASEAGDYCQVPGTNVWWPESHRDVLPDHISFEESYITGILNMKKEPPVEIFAARNDARNVPENLTNIAANGLRDKKSKGLHLLIDPNGKPAPDNAKLRFYPRLVAALIKFHHH